MAVIDRRLFLQAASVAGSAAVLSQAAEVKPIERKGRLKQSVCRWCYSKIPIEDFARESARLGLRSIDLPADTELDVIRKYGLLPTMLQGATTIADGFNRKENHTGIENRFRDIVARAVEYKSPSIIVFSGNRRGMSDDEGLENCVTGVKKVMP